MDIYLSNNCIFFPARIYFSYDCFYFTIPFFCMHTFYGSENLETSPWHVWFWSNTPVSSFLSWTALSSQRIITTSFRCTIIRLLARKLVFAVLVVPCSAFDTFLVHLQDHFRHRIFRPKRVFLNKRICQQESRQRKYSLSATKYNSNLKSLLELSR